MQSIDDVVAVDDANSGQVPSKTDIDARMDTVSLSYRPQRTESPRAIRITGFEERKGRVTKHHVFLIQVEPPPPGVINVARRFNDFKWLRARLSARFPGVFVPPLPPNKLFGRYESEFVKERQQDLERFLNRVEEIRAFSECVEFRLFLSRPESTLDEGKKEIVEQFESNRSIIDTTKDLITLFPDLHNSQFQGSSSLSEQNDSKTDNNSNDDREINNSTLAQARDDVTRLKEFLIKVEVSMKQLEQCANKLYQNLVNVANEMGNFSDAFGKLYIAESNYPYKPNVERLDLRNEFDGWKIFENNQTDAFYNLFFKTLRHEHEDVVAFLELLKYWDGIDNELNKIKLKMDKWGNLEYNVQELTPKQIESKNKDVKDEKEYTEHLKMVTKVILHSEMPVMWKFKTSEWRRHILEFAKIHQRETDKMMQTWKNMPKQE